MTGTILACSEWPSTVSALGSLAFLAFFLWMAFR